jgi:hypothetical protein
MGLSEFLAQHKISIIIVIVLVSVIGLLLYKLYDYSTKEDNNGEKKQESKKDDKLKEKAEEDTEGGEDPREALKEKVKEQLADINTGKLIDELEKDQEREAKSEAGSDSEGGDDSDSEEEIDLDNAKPEPIKVTSGVNTVEPKQKNNMMQEEESTSESDDDSGGSESESEDEPPKKINPQETVTVVDAKLNPMKPSTTNAEIAPTTNQSTQSIKVEIRKCVTKIKSGPNAGKSCDRVLNNGKCSVHGIQP